jgi:acetolactate synthase-1/3 small subunit
MFRRRGFNIESITVGSVEEKKVARMTIVVRGDEKTLEQVVKQLRKLIEVLKVIRLDPKESVFRELALIKVHVADSNARADIVRLARIFRARIVDVAMESMIIEITGDSDKINAFMNLVKTFGVKELSRTGLTALARGPKGIRAEEHQSE